MTPTFSPDDLLCGRFQVVRLIARGGMGELYEARDLELNEQVAVKTIRADIAANDRMSQRFRREVQLARKVTHPNICRIFDLFQHQPSTSGPAVDFITMELIEGETLADRLKREGRFTPEHALPIITQLASALAAAHSVGVVHRDLKTSNVMLMPAGGQAAPRVVITDFGIAHRLVTSAVGGATTGILGEVLGTPDYMAPEQIEGAPITPATDVYSFGIVMYEMLTNARPFAEETPLATALRRVSGPPPRSPRQIVPEIPAAWDAAIMRCLARHPDNRFPDAASIVPALTGAAAPARGLRAARLAAIAGVAAAIVLGAVLWSTRQQTPATPEATISAPTASAAVRPAVAVLGFRNLANRADVQWLSTALSEMLTSELGAGESLRTIPGENVGRMKVELGLGESDSYGADTMRRIQRNLGTDLIVYGSYTTIGQAPNDSIRFDIRLQNAQEEESTIVVSETGRADDLFALVSRAGQRLRERLAIEATPADVASVRASLPASALSARLYAEGVDRLRRFDAQSARTSLEQAIAQDPNYPLAHAALASAWAALGYDLRASDAARRAFELSSKLPRKERLAVEGNYRELANAWPDAIRIFQTLATFFPDDVEYALRLANAQMSSGVPKEAMATIDRFRQQFPAAADPRLDIAESTAAETTSDFKRAYAAAVKAVAAADAQGAQLLVAAAKLRGGAAAFRLGQIDHAIALMSESRELYEKAGDRGGVARTLNNLATVIGDNRGDERGATRLYEEGLTIARAVGDQDLVARLLNNLAIQHRQAGNLQASLQLNQESLAIRREIGDRTNTAISLNNIGNVLLDLGDLRRASEHYAESAAMSREIGDRRGLARALYNAAESLKLQGEVARALATSEEALAIRRALDDPASLSTSLYGHGQALLLQGDLPGGTRLLNEAQAIDRKLDRRRPIGYQLFMLGEAAFAAGDLAAARRYHQESLDMRLALGEQGTAAEGRTAMALIAVEDGRAAEAEALVQQAIPMFVTQKARDNEAMARAVLAQALAATNRMPQARAEAERAERLTRDSQHVLVRMPVLVTHARLVVAPTNMFEAKRTLEGIAADAARRGIPRYEFEARRALAELDLHDKPADAVKRLQALRRDAKARGFGLYAR